MKIYRSLAETPPDFGPSALTIGNFDGVHHGHRRILRRVQEVAREHGWKPSVLTFDPHPTCVVAPERSPLLMTSPEQRAELMAEEGIEQVLILPFTSAVALLPAEEFVRQVLLERLGARAVLVGDNFRFGHGHAGNVGLLAELGRQLGFITEVVPAVTCRGRIVSSSAVRELVRAGQVSLAGRLLERPYALEGEVVSGRGVGRKQTVPTLNLATRTELIPARGVYITRTRDLADGREWSSITNVGYRPTFGDNEELTVETFLLDAQLPAAGANSAGNGSTPQAIRVEFLKRVRDERKFETPEALRTQILKDVGAAKRYFRRRRAWAGRVPCTSS
jgi:riboflavin kinase/FMN adenylyltransferase